MHPKVLITTIGKDAVIATEKANSAMERLSKAGHRVVGVAPMGLNIMISYMEAAAKPVVTEEEVKKAKMPDGSKRYVTPEEMKALKENQQKALIENKGSDTMKKKPKKGKGRK